MRHFTITGSLLFLSFILFSGCTGFLYFPDRNVYFDPEKTSLGDTVVFEDLSVKSFDNTKLHGWKIYDSSLMPKNGMVLQVHGNAENITTHFKSVFWLVQEGYDVFVFDYRGYGKSEGTASYPETARDTAAFIRYVRNLRSDLPFYVIGQSLGGSMAMLALAGDAKDVKIDVLVLDSTFSSFKAVTHDVLCKSVVLCFMSPVVTFFMPPESESGIKLINEIPVEKILIHGKSDNVIPFNHSQDLYEMAQGPKSFLIHEGKHIAGFIYPKVKEDTLEIFSKYTEN